MIWRAAPPLAGLPESGSVAESVVAAAGLALGCWLVGLPPALAARAVLKLPPSCDVALSIVAEWPEERREAWMELQCRVFSFEEKRI
jgi:hypothetical protein